MTAAPLRRNRDFVLLQTAALLSSGGSQITAISYPLLVLALTGSPAKAGIVAFARLLGMALFALPAGLAADHWSRRRLMIAAHAARALVIGSLAALILLDEIVFWVIPLVAFVEGTGAAIFAAAQAGALKAVVPRPQLPGAVAIVTGREAAISLAAPALGGALFVVSRALPFVVHAISYAFSTLALLAMRTPFQEERERDRSPLRSRLAEGFRFLWDHSFLRTCAFLYGLTNFIGPGVLLAVVVIGKREGLSGGEVGLLLSCSGHAYSSVRSCRRSSGGSCPFGRCCCSNSGHGSVAASFSSGRTCTSLPRASSPPHSRSRRPIRSSRATSSR